MTDADLKRLIRILFIRLLVSEYLDLYMICLMQYFQQPNAEYLGAEK